jgi:hypothetical protein
MIRLTGVTHHTRFDGTSLIKKIGPQGSVAVERVAARSVLHATQEAVQIPASGEAQQKRPRRA